MSQDLALLLPAAKPESLMNQQKGRNGSAEHSGANGFGNVLSDQIRQGRPAEEALAGSKNEFQQKTPDSQPRPAGSSKDRGRSLPPQGDELPRDARMPSLEQHTPDVEGRQTAADFSEMGQEASMGQLPLEQIIDAASQLSALPAMQPILPMIIDGVSPEGMDAATALLTGDSSLVEADPAAVMMTMEGDARNIAVLQSISGNLAWSSGAVAPATPPATGAEAVMLEEGIPVAVTGAMAAQADEVLNIEGEGVADQKAGIQAGAAILKQAPGAVYVQAEEGQDQQTGFASVLAENHSRATGLQQAMASVSGVDGNSRKGDMSKPLSVLQELAQVMDASQKGQVQPPQGSTTANTPAGNATLPASHSINLPLPHPKWGDAMAERVVWLVNNQMQEAGLRLNPAHLGPIDVKISMENDQANILFTVQHGPVKEAVEAALPRLREMLAQSGVQLQDANVSDHQARREHQQASREYQQSGQGRFYNEEPETASAMKLTRLASHSLVDYYI